MRNCIIVVARDDFCRGHLLVCSFDACSAGCPHLADVWPKEEEAGASTSGGLVGVLGKAHSA